MYQIIQIEKCPRCDGSHADVPCLEFRKRFMQVGETIYTHWTYCPSNLEPVLVTLRGSDGEFIVQRPEEDK